MTVPKVVERNIPEHLTRPTDHPLCEVEANGDLVVCIRDLRTALDQANADKAAIRAALDTEAAR